MRERKKKNERTKESYLLYIDKTLTLEINKHICKCCIKNYRTCNNFEISCFLLQLQFTWSQFFPLTFKNDFLIFIEGQNSDFKPIIKHLLVTNYVWLK